MVTFFLSTDISKAKIEHSVSAVPPSRGLKWLKGREKKFVRKFSWQPSSVCKKLYDTIKGFRDDYCKDSKALDVVQKKRL